MTLYATIKSRRMDAKETSASLKLACSATSYASSLRLFLNRVDSHQLRSE